MPPRVALKGAAHKADSNTPLPLAEYGAQPKVVQFKSKSTASSYPLEIIFDCLNTCFLRINRHYVITDANPTVLRWFKSTRDNIIGCDFNRLFSGLDENVLRDAVEAATYANCRLPPIHRPDQLIDLHIHPDRQGAIAFFKDVSEQQPQGESASRTSELLQASLNSLSAHVVILDKTGAIVASNLAWQRFVNASRLSGVRIDRLPNYLSLYDNVLQNCPQAQVIKEELVSVLSGRRQTMRQVYMWCENRNARWFELKARRLDHDRESHVVVTNDDVTAVKEAERALGEAAESLLSLQEEERQRIAEDLHDSTAQHLVAASLNLMGLRSRIDPRGEAREFLQRIESSLSEASKELRTLTYLLHPPFLEANGLQETMHRYVEGFSKRTGVKVRLKIAQGVDQLPIVLQRPVFRIVQEALANVHRHASASRVSIDLRCILDHVHLVVRDNGRGMGSQRHPGQRLSEPSSLGVGIPGIRARLRQFGGKLVIKSGPRGTMLHAIVPAIVDAADSATGHWQSTGNFSRAFGVSADVKKKALQ